MIYNASQKRFRVFDRVNKIMSLPVSFEWFLTGDEDLQFPATEQSLPLTDFIFYLKDFIILQSIGLNDQNGTEIFEGDIISCSVLVSKEGEAIDMEDGEVDFIVPPKEDYGYAVVEYHAPIFIACMYGDKPESEDTPWEVMPCDIEDDCIVIGNIYENPEILKIN